jgi:hypothetical protein
MKKTRILTLAAVAAVAAAAAPALAKPAKPAAAPAAPRMSTLTLDKIAARVIIIPEDRNTITAEVRPGAGGLPKPVLRVDGSNMTVLGGLTREQLKNCHASSGKKSKVKLGMWKRGYKVEDLPTVTVRVPRDIAIVADGAIMGEIGPSRNLALRQERCGDWKVGDVSGSLQLDMEGWSDVNIGTVGAANVNLEGLGDISVASTRSLTANLEGMGDLTVGSVSGPVDVSLQGMGDVRIRGGRATTLKVRLEGMGDMRFDGVADTVDASTDGFGDIVIAKATGEVHSNKSGFGKIRIGR